MDNKTVLCTTAIATVAVFHIVPSGNGVVRVIGRCFWFPFQRLRVFGVIVEIPYHKQNTANDTKHHWYSVNFGKPKTESERESNNRY